MNTNVSPRLNADLLESQYHQWKDDPRSVDPTWSAFFEGFELGMAQLRGEEGATSGSAAVEEERSLGHKLFSLVYSYRATGHTQAWLDPLAEGNPVNPMFALEEFGLSEADLDREVATKYFLNGRRMKLREMIDILRETYCKWIGWEYMHIQDREMRYWLRNKIEQRIGGAAPEADWQERALKWVLEAEMFENFLGKKFIGEKRFSIEGGESAMVALNTILERSPSRDVREIVMGMAHRGRLNVLANFLQKPLTTILYEFTPNYMPDLVAGDGDVKYHLGYQSTRESHDGGKVDLYLAANPSHLEAVNSVVQGVARARQRQVEDMKHRAHVLPILIHGDAAFAGQGTVAEMLNFSQLTGYRTGGTIHLIINNQIGFTTMPSDARSSHYCTDVAKMIEAPVFHVNGDKPLEVMAVAELALEYRQRFSSDVVIDMVCYRRQGHNEADQAAFTQPHIARKLVTHPSTATLFRREAAETGIIPEERTREIERAITDRLEGGYTRMRELEKEGKLDAFSGSTGKIQPPYSHDAVETGITIERLRDLGRKIVEVPERFNLNQTIEKRFLPARAEATENGGPYDWGHAEALAWAALLTEGNGVRLSGQDCRRGTFSHRHAVLYDSDTRERWIPLQHLAPDQAPFRVYNSLLSEAAVLGFEYGYSVMAPDMLIMWEAQFGDFANGAQVIIDQFISSAESKWQQNCGITLLLPHGYEGMGPEHSSARLERYLQLCAENNMIVGNLTTPAQYFHALRRQVKRPFRKPLVLMTPKSLLRHPECVSTEADFAPGTAFREILPDPGAADPSAIRRLVFCTGKVYYDLIKQRRETSATHVAIIRVEQLYPLHRDLLLETIAPYSKDAEWVWCQEEPENMGAWSYIRPLLEELGDRRVRYAGRDAGASPAVGAKKLHVLEQNKLMEEALRP
jgi:2-oxoglutarate dehydrogenase E1 component